MIRRTILMVLVILILIGIPSTNSNYQFQITATNEVPLGPISFSPAADTYQYVDATYVETYGTVAADPPAGMGADSTATTNMTEASYAETSYVQLEYASFSSLPTGWFAYGFSIYGGIERSTADAAVLTTVITGYDLSTYTGARLTYQHRAYDFENYPYEVSDWEIHYVTDFDPFTSVKISDVAAADASGAWKDGDTSQASTSSAFVLALLDMGAASTEQIETDNWYIYAITETTYYRFEAVFRFDSVTQALASYALYIDFSPVMTGSDDLDFWIGTTTNPTNKIASDKQDDFNVIVTSYITASPVYLKIADTYRSGDTGSTTAYIARCYLYTPEETVSWYDNDWLYRKQISVVEQAGAGTNYQIPITGYYDNSTKDVAGSVDFEALCQSDFDDIRFTASNGTTLLDYWIDPDFFVSGTSAKFWLEIKADVSSTASDVKIYTYFGHSDATNTSNAWNTFLLFDDFDDASINTTTWGTETGTPAESGGYLILTGGTERVYSTTEWNIPVAMVARSYFDDVRTVGFCADTALAIDQTHAAFWDHLAASSNGRTYVREDANIENDLYAMSDSTWYNLGINWYSDTHIEFFVDGTERGDTVATNVISSFVTYPQRVWFYVYSTDSENLQVDWIYVRKIVETEPTFAAPAGLEYQNLYAPVMNAASYSPLNPTTATGITLFAIVTDADSIDLTVVYFVAIAYPAGFNDSNYYATEVGTNVWTYTFAENELDAGVYCFVAHATDTQSKFEDTATYDIYQTFQVTQAEEDQITCYIVVFDNLGNFIPFETFEVYRNNARQYTYSFTCYDYEPQNITVEDRWGEALNTTEFDAGTIELVVTVEVYSFKIMSWYEDFCYFNITRSGLTYAEVISPMETVSFRLFTNNYTIGVNYRNNTGWFTYNVNLINSTALVVMGDTIADVAALSAQLVTLSTDINVTLYSTQNQILTISIDLDNVNTTINTQLIQVLLDITNTNSTIFNQVVDLLAELQNVNTTLYDQTVAIVADISNVNSTLHTQFVSVLADIENMNSTLYAQTVTMLADISNVNTTIYAQTVSLLANIANLDSDIAAQTVTLLASIENVNSTIYSQTVEILSDISNVNSTIYAQTVEILADISNVNTTLYAQTVTLLANIANIDSDIAAQTVTLLASISNVNTTIYAQTVEILADISNVNTTLYSQTVEILSDISNVNSTLYSQAVTILSSIANVNSTIYAQTTIILSYALDTNTAVNLVLNPDTFYIMFADISFSDDFGHIYGMSNWHNATVTVYENDVQIVAPFSELVVPVLYAMSTSPGTYNVSAKFVSGANTAWYNTSYTIAELIAFKLSEWDLDLHLGIESFVEGYVLTTWENATIRVYDNGTLMVTVLEGEGGTNFYWWMREGQGIHNIVLNITNGATTVTKTRSYFIPDWASTGLVGFYDIWNHQENGTSLYLESNWGNCTVSVYLNGTLMATSSDDPAQVFFDRTTNVGTFNLTIVWDGGTQTYTLKNIYFTVTEEGTTYISGGFSEINYNYEGDTTTYEEDPEKFVTFVIAVTTLVILSIFIGGVIMWWENGKEKKRDFRAAVSGGQ